MTDTPTEREEGGAWAKLRRRKVVQWGIAYAAGAWGLLQGAQFLAEAFGWSSRVLQLGTVAALIGLPIVLVLAWYHGDRGQQRVSGTELTIVTLLFLVGGGLFWRYHGASEPKVATASPPVSTSAAEPSMPADTGPSIAVLPFDNRSDEKKDAYFVDGIHDDILTQLSKVSALKVISRTSVEQFRDTKLPIKEIAGQLGVRSILEGGVQRGGDRVRINVQLIDAGTDAHLWAETYDRELTAENIFAIQSELATAIAGALKAALTEEEKARVAAVPTQNLEAWEAYQLGRQRMAKRTSAGLAEAEEFFRKAVALDPSFALAHVGLGDTLRLQTEYSARALGPTLDEADQAISRALELDPNLAEAWASKGGLAMSRRQDKDAEQGLRRAIELNPNYAPAHHWLSMVLRGENRLEDELEHAERAVQLDPVSVTANGNLGSTFERMGRFDEAAARYRRASEIDPLAPTPLQKLADLNVYALNRHADSVRLLERAIALDSGNPQYSVDLAAALFSLGDTEGAARLVAETVRRWPDDAYANAGAAFLATMRGDIAAADRHANKALAAYPRYGFGLAVLRDGDLQRGDVKAARTRYASAFPELYGAAVPQLDLENFSAAVDLALVMQRIGERDRVTALLEAAERYVQSSFRLGWSGYGITDVQIHALRGDKAKALAALREAEKAGWRYLWRYHRDIDLNLDSIREEPDFKAVFGDIERDMARQRAELAARPKDAPLELESD